MWLPTMWMVGGPFWPHLQPSAAPDRAPPAGQEGTRDGSPEIRPDSAVEELPQHVVHGLAVLRLVILRLRLLRRQRRLGGSGWRLRRCVRLGLRLAGGRDAAAPAAARLLEQVAERLPDIAAQRTVAVGVVAGSGRIAGERAQNAAETAAIRPEQALAHFAQLGVGPVGIVEDALHLRIDARLRPWSLDHHGNAEADGIGGAALALGRHHELRLDAEAHHLGAEIDG